MIRYAYIDGQVLARLGAQGTDHYHLNKDRIPAINGAQEVLLAAVNSLFAEKKASPEQLRDLSRDCVFQTNNWGQIEVDRLLAQTPVKHRLWTVTAVYPEFVPLPANANVIYDPLPDRSQIRTDVRMVEPLKAAKHYTQEYWASIRNDVFAPGNSRVSPSLRSYGYLFTSRPVQMSGTYQITSNLLTVLPQTKRLVNVSYLKVPDHVQPMANDVLDTTVELEWPDSMGELLISVMAKRLVMREGDGTTINSLTTQEMSMLINALA